MKATLGLLLIGAMCLAYSPPARSEIQAQPTFTQCDRHVFTVATTQPVEFIIKSYAIVPAAAQVTERIEVVNYGIGEIVSTAGSMRRQTKDNLLPYDYGPSDRS